MELTLADFGYLLIHLAASARKGTMDRDPGLQFGLRQLLFGKAGFLM